MNTKGLLQLSVTLILVLTTMSAQSVSAQTPQVLYVKPGGLTSGSCDSWDKACELQYALMGAAAGQEFWVAVGVYKPTSDPTDRSATFQLKSGVGLYGGFVGTETARDQRDWEANKTVLSGDIDNNDINIDGNFIAETTADIQGGNTYHVINASGTDNTTVLDGFIVNAGQANADYFFYAGGGMYNVGGSPTLENLTFSANLARVSGAGMYNESCSNPILKNVTFSFNIATNYPEFPSQGGGMYTDSYCNPILSNVIFFNNSADQGGGMYNHNNHPTLTNVVFHKNSAREGGGIYNDVQGSPTLTNVTFFANTASYGGGLFNYDYSSVTLINSILWGDIAQEPWSEIYSVNASITITYSNVQGGWPSTGNIDADPLFVEPASGDLHLQLGSPAIDAGTNSGCPSTDLDGNSRPKGSRCDMGAYESKWPSFVDVPVTHPYFQDIEILYANGLTAGCQTSPLKFCPDQIMNRGQAAVFMLRGNFGSSYVPPVPTHIFKDDWTKGPWAEQWAEGMYKKGLSAGCSASPLKYCPWDLIPREQAVIFALRMKYGTSYKPPAAKGTVFADMTNPSYYATSWAEQAYKDGLIPNCGTSGGKPKFCPKDLVRRGLAAYMIVRAKNLMMP